MSKQPSFDSGSLQRAYYAAQPDDIYTSLEAAHAVAVQRAANDRWGKLSGITFAATDDGNLETRIGIDGAEPQPVTPTNWAYGQLAGLAQVPQQFIDRLPAKLAADVWNDRWNARQKSKGAIALVNGGGSELQLRAINGPQYGRIRAVDEFELAMRFRDRLGLDLPPTWRNPAECYMSDRDETIPLISGGSIVNTHTRPNGKESTINRGIVIRGSEVGARYSEVFAIVFEIICGNLGLTGLQVLFAERIRHTGAAIDRFNEDLVPASLWKAEQFLAGKGEETALIARAQATLLPGPTPIDMPQARSIAYEFARRFTPTGKMATQVVDMAYSDQGDCRTYWHAASGATALAQTTPHSYERIELARIGSAMLASM